VRIVEQQPTDGSEAGSNAPDLADEQLPMDPTRGRTGGSS
jgi:hypothetical protein